VSIVWW